MNERREVNSGFITEAICGIRKGFREIPTYPRQLRQFAIEQPAIIGLAVAATGLGIYLFGFSEDSASLSRQFLPKLGVAFAGAFALSVPFAALTARSERRRFAEMTARNILQMHQENAEDIERNDIMPGLF
ncbi:hypothetical protein HYT74_02865 [Candidatus Daviesbacteria bacterium]|nr:hypothetical protein [Candidatus Daviesbacteria bacterium]